MRSLVVLSSILLAVASLQAQGCNLPNCHNISGGNVHDGNGGPFLTGHVYLVNGIITVPVGQTLTIQPGAIVKFGINGTYQRLVIGGTLKAVGNSAMPILITSERDDTGGDHNADGSATSPGRGNWAGIVFNSSSTDCELEWVDVRYTSSFALYIYGPSTIPVRLKNVHVDQTSGTGLYLRGANPGTVEDCSFDNGNKAVDNVSWAEVEKFSNCTATGNTLGNSLVVQPQTNYLNVNRNTSWDTSNTLNGDGVVLLRPEINYGSGFTFTLGAGMNIKWTLPGFSRITMHGTINCNGTASNPVIFTSAQDDTAGGDSLGDGPTSGMPGDWWGMNLYGTASASSFDWTEFRYARDALNLVNCDIQLTNCTFAHSLNRGLVTGNSLPVVANCDFVQNDTAVAPFSWNAMANISGNTASGNASGDVMVLGGGSVSGNVTLDPAAAFNGTGAFLLSGTVTVGSGNTLNLSPGVVIKGDPTLTSRIHVFGELHCGSPGSSNPVIFTSFYDDSIGGDLNSDGNATSPSPGDWHGVRLFYSADASTLVNTTIRYGGKGASAALYLDSCDASLTAVRVEHSDGPAMQAMGSHPVVDSCAFDTSQTPVEDLPITGLAGLTNCTAAGNAMGDVIRLAGGTVSTGVTIQAVNALNGTGVFVLDGTITVGVATTLTIGQGVIFKFSGNHDLLVTGVLDCLGTVGNPVVFTSIADDTRGGDSGGDGPSAGSLGDWGQLLFNYNRSTLTNVLVRFAGNGNEAAIAAGHVDLDRVTVEDCLGNGVDMLNQTNATVVDCVFVNCSTPVTRVPFAGIERLSGNSSTGCRNGDMVRISVTGGTTSPSMSITPANSMNGNGIFVLHGDVTVPRPTTVAAGVIFKFRPGAGLSSTSNGPLTVNGTAASPVVFTALADDTFGGADNDPAAPTKGDWDGLTFANVNAGTSSVDFAIVRYAGQGGIPSVSLSQADVAFCNLVVEQGAGIAVDANYNSSPVLKNPTFRDNCGQAVDGITWAVLGNMTGVTAVNNGGVVQNATYITSPLVEGELTIEKDNYFGSCIVVTVTPQTGPNDTLSFGRGVIVKSGFGVAIPVEDVFGTGFEKVVFTSILDDEYGGDTNGDGNASSPSPGVWQGVIGGGGRVEHAISRYGGEPGNGYQACFKGYMDAVACRAEFSSDYGFCIGLAMSGGTGGGWLYSGDGDNLVAYQNAGIGIMMRRLRNCTSVSNGGHGIQAYKASYCISWNNGPTGTENYTWSSDNILYGGGTNVVYSCGTTLSSGPPAAGLFGNCGSAGWGNIDVNPQFVNMAAGDLRLTNASPCRNYPIAPMPQVMLSDPNICKPWGIVGQGYPEPAPSTRDYRESPRPLDDDFGGPEPFLADIGAYERGGHEMVVTGDLELGASTFLAIGTPQGVTGSAVYLVGSAFADLVVPGWGVLMVNPNNLLTTVTLPLTAGLPIQVPYVPVLAGLPLDIQAVILRTGEPVGAFSEIFRGRFHY